MPKKKKQEKVLTPEEELERTIEIQAIEEAKTQKKGEFGAFLILLLIAAILIGSVYIWYTKFYDSERDSWFKEIINTVNKDKYEIINYETKNKLKLINNSYLIDYDKDNIYKILDTQGNVLYEGETSYVTPYTTSNNELYFITSEDVLEENILTLYKLNNQTIDEIKTYSEVGHNFYPVIYDNNLYGISEEYDYYDEEDYEEKTNTILHLLDDTEYQINNGTISSEKTSTKEKIITNTNYLITISSLTNKYGIYDIKEQKQIIGYKYEDLKYLNDNLFIAKQNNKYGIINTKLKKLLDFEYDTLSTKDNFIYGIKDNNLYILDNDYNELSSLKNIDNQVINNIYQFTNKYLILLDDNYYLLDTTNNNSTKLEIDFLSITNDLTYTYNITNKEYTIYDDEFNKIDTISIKEYDINEILPLYLINNNTYVIGNNNYLYYDPDTKEFIDELKDYEYTLNDLTVSYNGTNKTVTILEKNKEKLTYNIKESNKNAITINEDKTFYYLDNNMYISIKKSE